MWMHNAFTTNPIALSIIHRSRCVVSVSAMKLVGCGLVTHFLLASSLTMQRQVKAMRYTARSLQQCRNVAYVANE